MVAKKVHRPRREALGSFLHRDWQDDAVINSRRGNALAKRLGYERLDVDFGMTSDGVWANMHGWPSKAFGTTQARRWTWRELRRMSGGKIRSGARAIKDAADFDQSYEWEVKYIPGVTNPELRAAMRLVAVLARRRFGPDWVHDRRLVVKVLTDLAGGERYALRVCAAAHEVGIPTMLLVRGKARAKTYAGHDEVTYIRGSLNPRVRR
jgi:hypothetical protein